MTAMIGQLEEAGVSDSSLPTKPNISTSKVGLARFLEAQVNTLEIARAELIAGRKRSHWMWFIFPQLRALGQSETSKHFGIEDLVEAKAYVRHRTLGARLLDLTRIVVSHDDLTAFEIFGSPDDQKFRSSMTLFAAASPDRREYLAALNQFCGDPDPKTEKLLMRDLSN